MKATSHATTLVPDRIEECVRFGVNSASRVVSGLLAEVRRRYTPTGSCHQPAVRSRTLAGLVTSRQLTELTELEANA